MLHFYEWEISIQQHKNMQCDIQMEICEKNDFFVYFELNVNEMKSFENGNV